MWPDSLDVYTPGRRVFVPAASETLLRAYSLNTGVRSGFNANPTLVS